MYDTSRRKFLKMSIPLPMSLSDLWGLERYGQIIMLAIE
jgi:hypothetical protein